MKKFLNKGTLLAVHVQFFSIIDIKQSDNLDMLIIRIILLMKLHSSSAKAD